MVEYGQRPAITTALAGDYSERTLAAAWARSTGVAEVPPVPHKFNGILCFVLAWAYIFPAFIYYFWCKGKQEAYDAAMQNVLRIWKQNGSPDPYANPFVQQSLVQSPKAVEQGLAEKIQELSDLKVKGVLSEDEFAAAKKKLLGI